MSRQEFRPPWPRQIHLAGIGGMGMAGIALLLLDRGHRLSGSDLVENTLTRQLVALGVSISKGHREVLPTGTGVLIRSSAVRESNPEVLAARALGIPVLRRGEALAVLLAGEGEEAEGSERRFVGVAGTHGKTTTTAMLTQLLRASLGEKAGWYVGGESSQLARVARDGKVLAVECDESDGTLVGYSPTVGVITNIEFDHMETFADEAAFLATFERFARQAERLVVCGDDPVARRVGEGAITFGFGEGTDVRATKLRLGPRSSRFCVHETTEVTLGVPGRHNVLNALAAIASLQALGVECKPEVLEALATFQSVDRRFEEVFFREGIRVISDYAHHPTEVRVVLETARALKPERILAIYQPHRYSRTKALLDDFPHAFSGVDRFWLAPVYAASEDPVEGGTSRDLHAAFLREEVPCELVRDLSEAATRIRSELRSGDLLLILGAGDIVWLSELDWLDWEE